MPLTRMYNTSLCSACRRPLEIEPRMSPWGRVKIVMVCPNCGPRDPQRGGVVQGAASQRAIVRQHRHRQWR